MKKGVEQKKKEPKGGTMKVQIVGSHMCPGCVEILEEMKKRNVEVDFVNIFEDFHSLKYYLMLREQEDCYAEIRKQALQSDYPENGRLGIPCMILPDGRKFLDMDEALKALEA